MAARHMMIDFETLGTSPDTAVLSVGVVLFTVQETLAEKEWFFQVHDQLRAKSSVNFDTVTWWLGQESKAKAIFDKCKLEGFLMPAFVADFEGLLLAQDPNKELRVWGNGATFDVTIAENIFLRAGRPVPWKYFNVRCYRTLKTMQDIERGISRLGTKHCAIEDARFQAKCVQEFLKKNPGADK